MTILSTANVRFQVLTDGKMGTTAFEYLGKSAYLREVLIGMPLRTNAADTTFHGSHKHVRSSAVRSLHFTALVSNTRLIVRKLSCKI